MTRVLIAASILLLAGVSLSVFAESKHPSPKVAGFLPELTEESSPICERVLADVRRWYRLGAKNYREYGAGTFPGMTSAFTNKKGELVWAAEAQPDLAPKYLLDGGEIVLAGKKIRLGRYTHNGCGGACERYQILAWTDDRSYAQARQDDALVQRSPPESLEPEFYKGEDGHYYAIALEKPFSGRAAVHAYQLQADASWTRSCYIPVEPEAVTVLPELLALELATQAVMKEGGSTCGSMRTRERWMADLHKAVKIAMYHPKALQEFSDGRSEYVDEFGLFAKDIEGLTLWGLMDIADQELFQQLRQSIGSAKISLAAYYQQQYGWTQSESESFAKAAVEGAVSRAIRFYQYTPISTSAEQELRAAILAQEPIERLKQRSLPKTQLNGFGTRQKRDYFDDTHGESLLNIAVGHPAALQWLLEQGGDPNWSNDFGKTPLMYAVQQNQPEAVRLLLRHGANPNAATVWPIDSCYYALSTVGATPLHYAARYASDEVIDALVAAGAETYLRTRGASPHTPEETASDWLLRYRAESPERDAMLIKLASPSEAVLGDKASKLVRDAEASYQAGAVERSLQLLSLALAAEPKNERALSSMSLVALRAGQPERAAEAAQSLLDLQPLNKTAAEVWFNYGLVCETMANQNRGYPGFSFNGNDYCLNGVLHGFVRAAVLADNPARRKKIVDLFSQKQIPSCMAQYRGSLIQVNLTTATELIPRVHSWKWIVSVLHPAAMRIEASDFAGPKGQPIELVSQLDLGEYRLTELQTDESLSYPYSVAGGLCVQSE